MIFLGATGFSYVFRALGGSNTGLMTWFGTLVAVNLQTAFMMPPFGATLFYMKGTARAHRLKGFWAGVPQPARAGLAA